MSDRRPSLGVCRTPHAARRTPHAAHGTTPIVHLLPHAGDHRPLPAPVASHPSPPNTHRPPPISRFEGLSPRRAEQHGSSLSCDGTCLAPSTTARSHVESSQLDSGHAGLHRATPIRGGLYHATSTFLCSPTLTRLNIATPRVASRHFETASCWLARAMPTPTTSHHPPPSLYHLSSATRRNSLRHGVIPIHIQSHAHELPALPSSPFRLRQEGRRYKRKDGQKYEK